MKLETITLKKGNHATREVGVCAMEAVAWLAGESHTDNPECACPVISRNITTLNDRMPDDATRNKYLLPLIGGLIGSRLGRAVEIKRAFVAADYAVRVFAPLSLEACGLKKEAATLRKLKQIVDGKSALIGRDAARKIRAYASAAAYAAASAASAASAARNEMKQRIQNFILSRLPEMERIT